MTSKIDNLQAWSARDARARFSELLDACMARGPQVVTRRGKQAAVLVSVAQWRGLQEAVRPSFKELLLSNEARAELVVPKRGGARTP